MDKHAKAPVRAPARTEVRDEATYRLAAIVDSSDDAIVSKDLTGLVRTWNPAAERIFGYSADEMIGQSIRVIIPEDQQDEEDEVLRAVRAGERVAHFETIRRRKDGRLIPISLTVSPVRDSTGRVIGASKVARDISAQRRAQEAMRESMALKDQFLGLVSHELRTPISVIVGNGQLLERRGAGLSDDARAQALADMVSEGERLQRIVENLLVLTRLDAGQREAAAVDLPALVEQVVSLARRRTGRSVAVRTEGASVVAGDETLIALVLQNLLSNAEKYSPATETIDVTVHPVAGGDIEVAVLDRGLGIDADNDELFEPFVRGRDASAHAAGMGLGLAVCRRAVEAQRGSISAQPRDGGGSIVRFTLPAFAGTAT